MWFTLVTFYSDSSNSHNKLAIIDSFPKTIMKYAGAVKVITE